MVRNYIPKKKNKTYKEDDMQKAVNLVENGKIVYAASKQCNVPNETLKHWIQKGAPSRFGSGNA